jgi:hypothetical protein
MIKKLIQSLKSHSVRRAEAELRRYQETQWAEGSPRLSPPKAYPSTSLSGRSWWTS